HQLTAAMTKTPTTVRVLGKNLFFECTTDLDLGSLVRPATARPMGEDKEAGSEIAASISTDASRMSRRRFLRSRARHRKTRCPTAYRRVRLGLAPGSCKPACRG